MPGVFPDYPAPVVRNAADARELTMMRWGMPPPPRTGGPPVTNIRNTSSPHWRGWLKPENRCLVPANSFAEHAPEPNLETKKKDVVVCAQRGPAAVRFRRDLDRVQGRPGHQVKTDSRSTSRLWIPDDCAERRGCADPSESDAGNPDDGRRVGGLDAGAMGRGQGTATAVAGSRVKGRRAWRRERRSGRCGMIKMLRRNRS